MTNFVGPHGQALLEAMAAAPRPTRIQAEMGATIRTLEARAADLEAEVRSMQRRLSAQTRQLLSLRTRRDEARETLANAYARLEPQVETLRAALEALLADIAGRGDGYCTPEAERSARAALEALK